MMAMMEAVLYFRTSIDGVGKRSAQSSNKFGRRHKAVWAYSDPKRFLGLGFKVSGLGCIVWD